MSMLITENFELATFIKPSVSLPNNLLVESYIQSSVVPVNAIKDREIAFDSLRLNPTSFKTAELYDIDDLVNESIVDRIKRMYSMALLVSKDYRFFSLKTKSVMEFQEGINRLVRVNHFYPENQPSTVYRAEYVLSLYR